ncbi:hypothetical protein F2Q70_00029569 [Brassica cretica]|uniref:Uncharacterized protein n=1 Tax=Brassica cretica TaxID=69181 RepID=A0A8S9FRZ1_BRACR|nr:hypothetical protein F2Q70_00029569 [Brassica cretica]KAF2557338.1 hypothetical protein F2Q68_00016227 [Brassica cretica]
MLSPPSGLESRDVAVRARGVCKPDHHQQQDHHVSAGAAPRRPPTRLLMRTSPHISIPIYFSFLLFLPINTLQLAQKFSVSPPSIDEEVLTSFDGTALTSID